MISRGAYLIFGLFNLIILIGVLIYFLKRPAQKYLTSRSTKLKGRRLEASESLAQAKGNYDSYYGRLRNVNEHMQELMDGAEREGEHEGGQMLVEAERVADRVIAQAMTRTDHEVKRKNVEFYQDIVGESVSQAKDLIKERMTIEKQVSMGRDFLGRLREEEGI